MSQSIQQQRGNARSKTPQRRQIEMQFLSLGQWLDKDHRVRNVWAYVESLDLSELYEPIKSTRDNVGRDPIDPRILFALWLFATIEGTTSARRIAELTGRDIPYMWICGGVSVNYHRLSDCRNRGLTQFRVRGLGKAKAQTLWHVLAYNFMRMRNLVCPLRAMSYLEVVMAN